MALHCCLGLALLRQFCPFFLGSDLEVSKKVSKYSKIFGQEKLSYQVSPRKIGHKMINFYRYSLLILNFFRHMSWTRILGFFDYDLKIIVDSAPLNSKDFDDQLSKFLIDIKGKIKDITLGTR